MGGFCCRKPLFRSSAIVKNDADSLGNTAACVFGTYTVCVDDCAIADEHFGEGNCLHEP